jgi:hypothetical protein
MIFIFSGLFTSHVKKMPALNVTLLCGKHIGLHVGQFVATAHTIPSGQVTIY